MTVKLKNESDKSMFEDLCEKNNVIIENVNILGYYDIILPENSKFYEIFTKFEESNLFSSVEIISHAKLLYDPGYSYQYYLENTYGYPDINIQGAWNITTGSPLIIVAVIDEGVDNDNTDIDDNIWTSYGWDYIDGDSNPDPTNINESHGTSVAGIIAAEKDNGLGISGISGGNNSTGCTIMSLRIFGYNGNTYVDTSQYIDDAIIYAANHGAKIINMSFAIDNFNDFNTIKPSIDAAIEYAYKDRGCLLVAAAGNYTTTKPGINYPARNPYVMAVGGINKNWSKYGRFGVDLELTAPSQGIYSLLTTDNSTPSDNWGNIGNGTSFSTAEVSGVAALIFSEYTNWINYDVRKILKRSAYDLGDTLTFGDGLLQANDALTQADPDFQDDRNRPQNVTLSGAYGSHPIISWDEVYYAYVPIDHYNIYRASVISGTYDHFEKVASVADNGSSSYSWTDNDVIRVIPRFANSTHYYRITSVDEDGFESVTSAEVSTTSNASNKKSMDKKNNTDYEYSLGNNYPNPFNPSTKIQYSLKEKGFVSLTVYDALGKVVEKLVNKQQSAGNYEVIFDATSVNRRISSGIYYYKINTENFSAVKKMLLLK